MPSTIGPLVSHPKTGKDARMDFEATFSAELFRWHSENASWFFVRLPLDVAEQARMFMAHKMAGFGSIRVKVFIGESAWATSIFPEKSSASYLLPIKADVRKANGLVAGSTAQIRLVFEA